MLDVRVYKIIVNFISIEVIFRSSVIIKLLVTSPVSKVYQIILISHISAFKIVKLKFMFVLKLIHWISMFNIITQLDKTIIKKN